MPACFPKNEQRSRSGSGLIRTILLGITILIPMVLAVGCDDATSGTLAVRIGDEWLTLEISMTQEERAQGLMFREEIPEDGGMIFIFKDARPRNFWMKNCVVDMDIVYVDPALRIVSAYNMKMQPPQRPEESEAEYEDRIRRTADYPSRQPAQYVIELKAGKIQELGLERGEKIEVDRDRLKELVRLADESP